jgi:hypothetical protein
VRGQNGQEQTVWGSIIQVPYFLQAIHFKLNLSSIEPLLGLFLEYPRKKEMVKIMNGKILST